MVVAKNKNPNKRIIRKAIGKQIRYLRRNLQNISNFKENPNFKLISDKLLKKLETIWKIYEQQKYMYDNKVNRVADRIVSLSKPHIRPIVRGKANAPVEFGAKITLSVINKYSYIERLDWNSYNEQEDLKTSVERYKLRFGYYPKVVLVDRIFNNRENRKYCKEKGIRLGGKPLGRPKIDEKERNKLKKQMRKDESGRVIIEGKFGICKRKYGMSRIMTKLSKTSESVIGLIVLVSNLDRKLRQVFCLLLEIRNIKNNILLFFSYFTLRMDLFRKP